MKIIIEKQTDKLGDEYLEQEDVVADILRNNDELIIEVDDRLYVIPFKIIKCL
jgi:hypothetical protein